MTRILRGTSPTTQKSPISEQVQIYEDILGDANGKVTTGLLTGVRYLKDNRILPAGFDKNTTDNDIAVVGPARDDQGFSGGGHRIRYSVACRETRTVRSRLMPNSGINPLDFVGRIT